MIEIYLPEQLEAFARNGTLLAASEELHITQPALSRNMKKLEDRQFCLQRYLEENLYVTVPVNNPLTKKKSFLFRPGRKDHTGKREYRFLIKYHGETSEFRSSSYSERSVCHG